MAWEAGSAYSSFGQQGFPKNNLNELIAPGVGNDNTQGYSIGSVWFNQTTNIAYRATGVGTGAATWVQTAGSPISPHLGSESLDTLERRILSSF